MSAVVVVLQVVSAVLASYGAIGGPLTAHVGAIERVEWVRADGRSSAWPMCVLRQTRAWSCWGVAREDRGIVVFHGAEGMWWSVVAGRTHTELRPMRWGRLLVLTGVASQFPRLRVTFAHPVVSPRNRAQAIRLDTARVPGAVAASVSGNAIWVAGDVVPPESWIEIASDVTGPVYLTLPDVAAGGVSVPLHVAVSDPRAIDGRVVATGDQPAAGALITLFRLIDPPPTGASRAIPRRVLSAERVADENGRFELPGLGDADYEILAWHVQLGRASLAVPRDASDLTIRLRSSGLARGRVLVDGHPIAGIDVISVPDAAAFSAAPDVTDVKGGDARTAADGRFVITLAPSGGGEVRIGGGAYPVKRIPLPSSPVPLFEMGDIDLGRRTYITVILDRDVGCGLRATGPVGRTGLQIVNGTRTASGAFELAIPEPGFWEFTLRCDGEPRALSPSLVQIGSSDGGRELRMSVR